ncbi:TonB-dependent receptor [Neoasaia chiangmaiensis]|uniref:TonB-dependent receptor n=1 Tax=Neoasaia chiangmaiensis TaxID=320497 RepID=UPI0014765A09|nr:TonB-dependent receptor [Neoasaia chiangmaiensis]
MESVDVRGGSTSANGVTNTTPGGGLMLRQTAARSQSTMTRDYIAKQSPATNVNALLNALPGVVSGSNSPIGDPSHDTVNVRGLTQAELGYEMEGAPLQDPVNFNVFSSDMVDTDNVSSIALTQGSSDIGAPFYSAVGGQVSVQRVQPGAKPGGLVDLSYGSRALRREFIRLESGEIGHSGVRSYASFSDTRSDPLRGLGFARRDHVDAMATKSWGDNNYVHAVFGWNDSLGTAQRYPTLAQYQAYGYNYGWDRKYSPEDTGYYQLHYSKRRDVLASLPTHLTLMHDGNESLTLDTTPYFVWDNGTYGGGENLSVTNSYQGTIAIPYLDTPNPVNGTQTAVSSDNERENSAGLTTAIAWNTAQNTLRFGYWYAYLDHSELESFSPLNLQGGAANLFGQYPIMVDGQVLSGYNINFKQQTNALFLEDQFHALNDRLNITAGFREVMISRSATNNIPGALFKAGGNYATPLPRFSASYKITKNDQIFLNATTGFHAPASEEVYIQLWDPTGRGRPTMTGNTNLKSEYAIGEELGYRHYGLLNATFTLFNYNLTNHQITSSGYVNSQLITQPLNIGGETIRGAQAEFGLRPWHHISPYLSFQYLHTELGNNYATGGDYLPTKGKEMVQSPKYSGSVGLSYDDGHFFGTVMGDYVGKQYSTFMNDQSIPGYAIANVAVGYRFQNYGFLKHPQIQLSINNISNDQYLSGVYGFAGSARARTGVYGTAIAASSPSYMVGAERMFVATITTGF